ncbi:Formimidoylglutamase [Thalassocella blandensis]|nr:Formimidoylglutamase [Thalassocella blandensis]
MTIESLKKIWTGRQDREINSFRWHQKVSFEAVENYQHQPVLTGFACDEGVRRNQGRIGAKNGPQVIRSALANLTCAESFKFFDSGDIVCEGESLEQAQDKLAEHIVKILDKNGFPLVIGGGHEVAFGSFSAIQRFLERRQSRQSRIGIINFDAHFDLRDPASGASSGTPFRQCQMLCESKSLDFQYCVLGVNPSSNTQALFDFAREHQVRWLTDEMMHHLSNVEQTKYLMSFLEKCDYLYITVCLDVFSSAFAPGVSAPAAVGIHPMQALLWLKNIVALCREMSVTPVLCDIAEMNPAFDKDNQTAKLAARIIYEFVELYKTLNFRTAGDS